MQAMLARLRILDTRDVLCVREKFLILKKSGT